MGWLDRVWKWFDDYGFRVPPEQEPPLVRNDDRAEGKDKFVLPDWVVRNPSDLSATWEKPTPPPLSTPTNPSWLGWPEEDDPFTQRGGK